MGSFLANAQCIGATLHFGAELVRVDASAAPKHDEEVEEVGAFLALKEPPHIAELAVGYTLTTTVSAVEDIYTHYTFDAGRASAFETWNNHIQSLPARAKEVQEAA